MKVEKTQEKLNKKNALQAVKSVIKNSKSDEKASAPEIADDSQAT